LQACEAIAEAHALGIVHRDIKPSNLFVTRRADGSSLVKVLDFGISKALEIDAQAVQGLTASGSIVGSPGYMSPEQLRAPKTVDARSDIWSLGVTLFELLTGKGPFAADGMGEIFARIVSEPAPLIRSVRPDVPEGLAMTIAQCLERDVRRRTQDVGSLASGLLPFAPPEAVVSVGRIVRIGGGGSPATLMAPAIDRSPSGGHERTETSQGLPVVGTDGAWLQSRTGDRASRMRSRRTRFFVAGAAGLVLAAVAIGTLVPRTRTTSQTVSNPTPIVPATPPLAELPATTPERAHADPTRELSAAETPAPIARDAGHSVTTPATGKLSPSYVPDSTPRPKPALKQAPTSQTPKPATNNRDIF
jgi:serine/threonine-protein kinase